MKSRLDILEELDIRCGQLDRCHSTLRHCGKKHFQNMVKGMRFCFFAAIAYAAVLAHLPRSSGIERQIKRLVYNNNGFGSYSFEFQTKDGTFRKEDGGIISKDGRGYVVRGEYGYIDPQGGQHLVRYVADANGFQPQTDDDFRSNDRRII